MEEGREGGREVGKKGGREASRRRERGRDEDMVRWGDGEMEGEDGEEEQKKRTYINT